MLRRSFALPALLLLAACGGESSSGEQIYDTEQAVDCIRGVQPAETDTSVVAEQPGSLALIFGEDRYSYMGLVLIVGYGPDQAAALGLKRQARRFVPKGIRGLPQAWGESNGNVVYEALGPTRDVGAAKVLPSGVSVGDVERLTEESSRGMREGIEDCLEEARS